MGFLKITNNDSFLSSGKEIQSLISLITRKQFSPQREGARATFPFERLILLMNQSIFSRTYFKFTISLVNSLGIHYFFHDFTIMTPLIVRVLTLNLLFLSRIHYGSINYSRIGPELTIFSRIHSQSIIFFANPLRIYYLFREFTLNSYFFSRIHYQFTICSRTHYESINFSRFDPEFTFSFANSLWIPYLFREITINSLWISYLFRESNINSLSIRELTRNPLIFCVLTLILLSLSRIHYGSFLY